MVKEEEKKDEIELVSVAASLKPAYKFPNGDIIESNEEMIVWIANEISQIRRALA